MEKGYDNVVHSLLQHGVAALNFHSWASSTHQAAKRSLAWRFDACCPD